MNELITDAEVNDYFADLSDDVITSPTPDKTFEDRLHDVADVVLHSQLGKAWTSDKLQRIAEAAGIDQTRGNDWIQQQLTRVFELPTARPAKQTNGATYAPANQPRLLSKSQFIADFVPPDYLWEGILQRRFVYGLTAKTGDGKTAFALLLARLISDRTSNEPASIGGHAVDKGTAIYFAGENPDDLRTRVIADDSQSGRDGSTDTISFIAGTFSIEAMFAECQAKAATFPGGRIDLVIVDTSAAYFSGDDEVDNTQMGGHARALRKLTTLPGGPCVLVLCHPVKHAAEQAHLLPRGGGAFIAELDGNLTLWKIDDSLIELSHNKMRGPGFEPMTFRLEKVLCDALIDAKGRHIPSVRAVPVSDLDQEGITRSTRTDEDTLLAAMLEQPGRSIAQLAATCGWTLGNGEPHKSKTQRRLIGLEKAGLAKKVRGIWELTDAGKKAAATAKPQQSAHEQQPSP